MGRRIFINYRRSEEWGAAQALYQHLAATFSPDDLFMDVEGQLRPGDDFAEVLTAKVAACDVLLALIGPRWAELIAARACDPDGGPESGAEDFVVIEIAAAFDAGKRVIPVLVGDAAMPGAEALPESIQALARLHAMSLRPERFSTDCQGLVTAIEEHFAVLEREEAARIEAERAAARAERKKRAAEAASGWRAVAAMEGLALVGLVGLVVYLLAGPPAPSAEPPPMLAPLPRWAEPLRVEEERALRPGSTFRECDVCPRMVVVPEGSFRMGSLPGGKYHEPDEDPLHTVRIPRPFAVGRLEVTFKEWDACVAAGGCSRRPDDHGWGRGARPVIDVSWDDVTKEYLPWLSRRTGKTYRLLTEAEWEYAARAGTTTLFAFGESLSYSQAKYWKDTEGTVAVGSFQPNTFGLYDMHGNVWEWVQDCKNDDYNGAPSDGSAWTTGDCGKRIVRGGSWYDSDEVLRSVNRWWFTAHTRRDDQGFRVARSILQEPTTPGQAPAAEDAELKGQAGRGKVAVAEPSRPEPTNDVAAPIPGTRPLTAAEAAEEDALQPGDSFKECAECPEMVVVPADSFTMGSPASETGRDSGEGPQRRVTIAQPFAVGRFEVTFAEWDACVADGGCRYNPGDSGWGRGKRPAINVSSDDIEMQYLPWLSGRTGKRYRLPTEAEWEYVARAGTTTPFWWGASITTDLANYNGNFAYEGGPRGAYRRKTVPVDSFAANPNPWGLHNVHGNVWEWVQDCWHRSYDGAPLDGAAWTAENCDRRVIRGGGWHNSPRRLRSAHRGKSATDYRINYIGFRVARTL